MENESNKPLLSICIPIYNRLSFLEKMLARFMENADLFEKQIHLFISDNCSDEDLESCCKRYLELGLKLEYHRNDENIGADKNFELCFSRGRGKYTWLLGSDDIPCKGVLKRILYELNKNDYGLVHLKMRAKKEDFLEFYSHDEILTRVNYWITYMSANIVLTRNIEFVDLSKYRGSFLIQVPMYLTSCSKSQKNAILSIKQVFENDNDVENNGGFNFFKVFVDNFYTILGEFVNNNTISYKAYERIKKIEFKEHLSPHIVTCLLLKTNRNYDNTNGWLILKKHFNGRLYVLYYIFISLSKWCVKRLLGMI